MRRLRAVAIAAVALAATVAPAPAGASITWGSPVLIDHSQPWAAGTAMNAISCPTSSFCVATDSAGNVLTSRDPRSRPARWAIAHVDAPAKFVLPGLRNGLMDVSCPTRRLCVAVDSQGYALTSRDPAGGGRAWTRKQVDRSHGSGPLPPLGRSTAAINAVSCPSSTACIAVDVAGNVLTARDPRGRWTLKQVDPHPGSFGLVSVDCPSTRLCVATDGAGGVLASANPFAAAPRWRRSHIDGNYALFGVSCASSSLCVAIDRTTAFVSSDPVGGGAAWVPVKLAPASTFGMLNAIACTKPSHCVVGDELDAMFSSDDPGGGPSAWAQTRIGGLGTRPLAGISGISCPTAGTCAAVDGVGNVLTSTGSMGLASWVTDSVDGYDPLSAISCPSASLCVAVDSAGKAIASTDPLDPSKPWAASTAEAGTALDAIACASASLCAAIDAGGNVVTSPDPAAATPTWSVTHLEDVQAGASGLGSPLSGLTGVSCPAPALCIVVDQYGNGFVSTDPAAGAWTSAHIDTALAGSGAASLTGVSCPSARLCVAVDNAGNALVSTDPAGGVGTWEPAAIDGSTPINAVSCGAATLCAAVDPSGTALVSRDPASGAPSWQSMRIASNQVRGLACAGTSLCAAFGQPGNTPPDAIVSSSTLNEPGAAWSPSKHVPGSVSGIACPTARACIAIDYGGHAVIGRVQR